MIYRRPMWDYALEKQKVCLPYNEAHHWVPSLGEVGQANHCRGKSIHENGSALIMMP